MGDSDDEPNRHDFNDTYCKIILGFITLSYNLIIHQIDIISRHFAVAFNIPIHNIGIYFDKLYSIRCLMILVGLLLEYIFFQMAGADRDEYGKHEGRLVRKYVAMVSFSIVLIIRVIFLAILYTSSQLSYDVYGVLSFEALFYGFFEGSFMGLTAKYISIVSLLFNLCPLFVFLSQFVFDRFWYERPLLMIRAQTWICAVFTAISVALWIHYILYLSPGILFKEPNAVTSEEITSSGEPYTKREPPGNDGINSVVSPITMYWSSIVYIHFLHPGTLPYGLLERDKCHLINMMMPIFSNLGPLTVYFIDDIAHKFTKWSWHFDVFWILFIPLPIILVYCFLAIHSRIPSARAIINSRPRVMGMTLTMIFCFSFLDALSYVGVAKYAVRGNAHGYTIQGMNSIIALLCSSLFEKFSVGYSDTRISLGYHLPRFRPNHRMSKSNLAWYIVRETLKRAWRDLKNDFKFNIKRYL